MKTTPTQRIAVLPDTVSFAAAAALPVAGLTALRTLRHGAPLLGKRVLITGAAGGVDHLAVQLAARSGARVTAVAGRPERAAGLRELGATDVAVGIEQAQGRFGLILESAGGASLATALHAVDANGAVVVFGNSSGEIAFDAQSGDSGSPARDKRMHKSILESQRYPDIAFIPDHVEGALSKASVHGMFRIHGKDHEMTISVETIPEENRLDITTHFIVPYVEWGMRNPSTFFLRVGDKVNIDVHATGRIQPSR